MHPLKLLIVEDSNVDRKLIQMAFGEGEHNVEIEFAKDGKSALDRLTATAQCSPQSRPDLCIFDINMPGLSGIELLEKVKNRSDLKEIPVVMLSGSNDRKDIKVCYELQASGYINKPDDFVDLKRVLSSLLDYWINVLCLPDRNRFPAH